jgi:hypothetical protein
MEIWAKFFNLRPNILQDKDLPAGLKPMTQCGSAMVMPRKSSIFPRIRGLESVKKWQRSYFYVKNPEGTVDYINLPKFVIGPPTQRTHWLYDPMDLIPEVNLVNEAIRVLVDEGMTADDLLLTFLSRRISPLQWRPHKMCYMSGRHDPSRHTTFELTKAAVYRRLKTIAKSDWEDAEWEFGRSPYCREVRAPLVSTDISFSVIILPDILG